MQNVSIAWQVAPVGSSSTVHTLHRYTCLHMRTFSNTFPPPLPADVMLYTRSSRRLYGTPRTTSPLSRSMTLAHTRPSRGSAQGRRGRGAAPPTADTAPPTQGQIPRKVSFPQPKLKGSVSPRELYGGRFCCSPNLKRGGMSFSSPVEHKVKYSALAVLLAVDAESGCGFLHCIVARLFLILTSGRLELAAISCTSRGRGPAGLKKQKGMRDSTHAVSAPRPS